MTAEATRGCPQATCTRLCNPRSCDCPPCGCLDCRRRQGWEQTAPIVPPPPTAIDRAVRDARGELADAEDLADAWERLERDWGPRVDRMRAQAQAVACCCPIADELEGGRCRRCQGWPR
jgi:hypothetical protein